MHKNIFAKVFGDKKRTFLIKMPFLGQLLKIFLKKKIGALIKKNKYLHQPTFSTYYIYYIIKMHSIK